MKCITNSLLDTLSFGEGTYVFKEDVIEGKLNLSVSRPFRKNTKVPFKYTDFTATGKLYMYIAM